MPPPRVGDLPRSMSMSLPTSPIRLENPQQTNPSANAGPQGPGPVAPPRVEGDPAIDNVVRNGEGPDLQPGNGQGARFAANHTVGAGRDWDLKSAEGMLDTARKVRIPSDVRFAVHRRRLQAALDGRDGPRRLRAPARVGKESGHRSGGVSLSRAQDPGQVRGPA